MAERAGGWRVRPIPVLVLVVLLVAAAGLAGCTRGGDRDQIQASISVSPLVALEDQPVAVTVRGLPGGAPTTLTARARDTDGITWSSSAQFQASSAGEVSLGQPSVGGSYTGVNPMGLFTLMAPPPGSAPDWFLYSEAGYDVILEAAVDGRVAAKASVHRQGRAFRVPQSGPAPSRTTPGPRQREPTGGARGPPGRAERRHPGSRPSRTRRSSRNARPGRAGSRSFVSRLHHAHRALLPGPGGLVVTLPW